VRVFLFIQTSVLSATRNMYVEYTEYTLGDPLVLVATLVVVV
jgi:hypothetical protein